MTLVEAEKLIGFEFNLDSENDRGRIVHSYHTKDSLPFYLAMNRETGLVIRKHDIRVLDELY